MKHRFDACNLYYELHLDSYHQTLIVQNLHKAINSIISKTVPQLSTNWGTVFIFGSR